MVSIDISAHSSNSFKDRHTDILHQGDDLQYIGGYQHTLRSYDPNIDVQGIRICRSRHSILFHSHTLSDEHRRIHSTSKDEGIHNF